MMHLKYSFFSFYAVNMYIIRYAFMLDPYISPKKKEIDPQKES